MKLNSPNGSQKLFVSENETKKVYLQDFSEKSGEFLLEVFLEGENAQTEIVGRIVTTKKHHKKWVIKIFFQNKNQTGVLDLRGVGEDESYLEIDGGGVLTAKSKHATAKISEKIILFDNAQAKAVPVLRVETDLVKTALHSASVSPIDTEKILFCQSRGMSNFETIKMLKKGFFGDDSKKQ